MSNSTIITASLDDNELRQSISNLVANYKRALLTMTSDTDKTVAELQSKLRELGRTNFGANSSDDGGSSKRTSALKEEETQAKKTAAAHKELKMTLDRQAQAQQVAIRSASPDSVRNADTLQTMNVELDLLRERLREARQQYSSFVALASQASTTGDKGLYQFATSGVHKYEDEVRSVIPQIRALQNAIQQMHGVIAPQGHTIQNYVNSLLKANPGLAALNAQYRSGTALLQGHTTSMESASAAASKYTEEIRKQAEEIRKSKEWKETGAYKINETIHDDGRTTYVQYEVSAKKALSIEEQLLEIQKQKARSQEIELQNKRAEVTEAYKVLQYESKTTEEQNKRKKYSAPSSAIGYDVTWDKLSRIIAEKNGIQKSEVLNWDEQYSSIKRLTSALNQYRNAYERMTAEERNSPFGKQMISDMRVLEQNIKRLRVEMSKPLLSFDAIKGAPERTLNDIAEKMRTLQSFRSGLDINTQRAEINKATEEYNRLRKKMDEIIGKNNQMIASNTALGRSWTYMKNRLAFYFTVGASTQFIRNLIEVRSQYEMNERALGILIDSAERGSQVFNELSQMALVSPYTLIELSSAAKQLTAYDVAAKDVVDTTRRLADMAAAVGIPIERLTYALGQIKAYGYLNSRDARMFLNAGIPIVQSLANHYSKLRGQIVSVSEVYDMMKKKSISYNDVMQVVTEMTDKGGRFFDFQAKMADTLKVKLANLTLAWNNMLNEMGESNQTMLEAPIKVLKELFLQWKDIEKVLNDLIIVFGIAKASQLLLNLAIGKGTMARIREIAAVNGVTAAEYKEVLAKNITTKAQAKFILLLNKGNVALQAAVLNLGKLTTAEYNATIALSGWKRAWALFVTSLKVGLQGLVVGLKAVKAAIATAFAAFWPLLLITAIVDLIQWFGNLGEASKAATDAIKKNAKEASEAIHEMRNALEMTTAVASAKSGTLKPFEAQKTWESQKEAIEKYALSYKSIVAELEKEKNINVRIVKADQALADIEKVRNKIAKLKGELHVEDDSWHSIFGEGLVSDLKDAEKSFAKLESLTRKINEGDASWYERNIGLQGANRSVEEDLQEARHEVQKFAEDAAETIKNALGDGINDPKQVREAIENVKAAVKEANPEIAGEAGNMFDILLDQYLPKYLGVQTDKTFSAQNQLLEALKEDYSSAFQNITEDALSKTGEMSQEQEQAIRDAFNALPPYVQSVLGNIDKLIKSFDFRIKVGVTFGFQQQNEFQKDFAEHFKTKIQPNYIQYNLKDGEDVVALGERLNTSWNNEVKALKTVDSMLKKATGARKTYLETLRKTHAANKQAIEDVAEYEGFTLSEKGKKSGKGGKKTTQEDLVAKALKEELSIIKDMRSNYEKLRKSGVDATTALTMASSGYEKSLAKINLVLGKYGIAKFNANDFVGKDSQTPRKLLDALQKQLDSLIASGKVKTTSLKDLEVEINKLKVEAKTYDMEMITKGLNSELDKLKDEYELAIELDANPELGAMFENFLGLPLSGLPRTAKEYAERYTKTINKFLSDKEIALKMPNLLNVSDNDIRELENLANKGDLSLVDVEEIKKAVKAVRDAFVKEQKEMTKDWQGLIKKYGELSNKLSQIYKDSTKEQVTIIKKFGNQQQTKDALAIQEKIALSEDPTEISRLFAEVSSITDKIADENPIALKLMVASSNELGKNQASAYWNDFKDSALYTSVFEDMDYVATSTLKKIIERLNELKDKVKEDPASMKALIKSLEDAEDEYASRQNPFLNIITSYKEWQVALGEVEVAKKRLANAKEVTMVARENVQSAKASKNKKAEANAVKFLTKAEKEEKEAEDNLHSAENKAQKGAKRFAKSVQGAGAAVGQVSDSLGQLSEFFREIGMEEMAEGVDAVNQGFKVMSIVIGLVNAALVAMEASVPWLLAIAAAVSLVVGLISFFSGQQDKKIDKQLEESQLIVERLELAYKRLEYAVEKAYGTAVIGAKLVAKANKELQLVEVKRQLRLEESRSKKKRDESKMQDLREQIIDLEQEIKDMGEDVVNDLLGISSVSDAIESIMSGFVDALRTGEDAMESFNKSINDMIANMVTKMFSTKVLGPWFEKQWSLIQNEIDARAGDLPQKIADIYARINKAEVENIDNYRTLVAILKELGFSDQELKDAINIDTNKEEILMWAKKFGLSEENIQGWLKHTKKLPSEIVMAILQDMFKKRMAMMREQIAGMEDEMSDATAVTTDDIRRYAELLRGGAPLMEENMETIKGLLQELGLINKDIELSALQQGIQSITEETAGALESYMNGVSQQVYYHSSLLEQIRDSVVGLNLDVSLGVQSQMLLQLQSSYQIQMSIRDTLQGWSNASGMAMRVEMI